MMASNVTSFRSLIDEMKAVAEGRGKPPVRAGKDVYASKAARDFARKVNIGRGAAATTVEPPTAGALDISTLAGVTRLMSRENQELLRCIAQGEVNSVAELAHKTGRAEPNVSRTLKKLADIGVVELVPGVGRAKRPRLAIRSFNVDIDVMTGSVRVVAARRMEPLPR